MTIKFFKYTPMAITTSTDPLGIGQGILKSYLGEMKQLIL